MKRPKLYAAAVSCLCAIAPLGGAPRPGAPVATTDSHSLFERETLTADWFGTGDAMREHGVNLTGSLTQFYQGLASGTGEHDWKYGDKLDAFLHLDGGKLGLWNGFGAHAHFELNFGLTAAFAGGSFLPNNVALFFPAANETRSDLSLYFSQQFGDAVTLMFGKINTIDLYDAAREFSGGRGIEQFMHVQLMAPASGITPPQIFGGVLSVKTKPAKFTLMVYDPANQTRKSGIDYAFNSGVVFNGSVELGSNFFGKPGKHIFNAAYSTQDKTDFSDPFLLLPIPSLPAPQEKDGFWYAGYAFEQTIWRDENDPKRGWGVFGQFGISDGDVNVFAWSALGGIGGSSPLPGRVNDKWGLGYFYVSYAPGLKDALRLAGVPARDEAGVEVFYNWAATPWLRITADAQFIHPPRGDRDTAVIVSLRSQVVF